MAPRGHRGADPQALRGLPAARRADHHLCQQARPRGPRPVLLDEIEQSLALDVTPASWPIGMGRDFLGAYDLFADALLLFGAPRPRPGHRARPLQRPRNGSVNRYRNPIGANP